MPSNLYPLTYKPGIKRDGTAFQPEYCTDGQWVRFQRGKIRKIGGMKGVLLRNPPFSASNIVLLPNQNNDNIFVYVAHTRGVISFIITQDIALARGGTDVVSNFDVPRALWQSEIVVNPADNQRYIVYIASNNGQDIAENTLARFFNSRLYFPGANENFIGINPLSNGGMCYSAPYLFLYGSNGIVQYSQANNPFDFTITNNPANSAGTLTISNDKVIYGRPIRGGANSPSILFWTLSSVVRIVNIGQDQVQFQKDVISKSSSILSSRCVVEYDGLFFWPGTDRFFVYNGIVTEVVNTMSLNYFYDNVDMNYRQKVFGVKNPRYGEIWWFYPEKGQDPNAVGGVRNTRALIYNKNENSWYDTAISRDCGVFSEDFGFMATYGRILTLPNDLGTYLWKHELPTCTEDITIPGPVRSQLPIPSFFKTPTFSFAAFNPTNQPGIDRWTELKRIEPDFKITGVNTASENLTFTINTKQYAESVEVIGNPIVITGGIDTDNLVKNDLAIQGRHITFTFNITGQGAMVEVGNILLLISIGDGK